MNSTISTVTKCIQEGKMFSSHKKHLELLLHHLKTTKDINITQKNYELPGNIKATSIVFKANVFGPNDVVFKANFLGPNEEKFFKKRKELWKVLRRGMSLHILHLDVWEAHLVCGMNKFANFGDKLHTYPHEDCDEIFATEKENGEWAGIASFETEAGEVLIFGTKNVHLMVLQRKFDESIALHKDNVLKAIYDELWLSIASIVREMPSSVFKYLQETGRTFVGEHISTEYQHIVDYGDCDSKILWFSITEPMVGFTSFTPKDAQSIFKELNLSSVEVLSFTREEDFVAERKKMEQAFNSEGWVVYRACKNKIYQVTKEKNHVYVVTRACREKIKQNSGCLALENRLKKMHISTDTPQIQSVINEMRMFYMWIVTVKRLYITVKKKKKEITKIDSNLIHNEWISLLNEFRGEPHDDLLNVYWTKVKKENLSTKKHDKKLQSIIDKTQARIVMFKGFPTSGKSTLARALEYLIPNSVWINQDELGNRDKFQQRFEKEIKTGKNKLIILDKSFHTIQSRFFLSSFSKTIVELNFAQKLDEGHVKGFIHTRLEDRKFGHKSLFMSKDVVDNLYDIFIDGNELLTDEELKNSRVLTLNPELELEYNVRQLNTLFDFNPDNIEEAIESSLSYERGLHEKEKKNTKNIAYWGLFPKSLDDVLAIPEIKDVYLNFPIVQNLHITLKYVGGKNKDDDQSAYIEEEGSLFDVDIISVVHDENLACLRCIPHIPKEIYNPNKDYHITLSHSRDVKPSYSMELLQDPSRIETELEKITVRCKLQRMLFTKNRR